jgi:hypothetical protein
MDFAILILLVMITALGIYAGQTRGEFIRFKEVWRERLGTDDRYVCKLEARIEALEEQVRELKGE